jgi:hypothetical protein
MVMSDIVMPGGMSGLDLARALLAFPVAGALAYFGFTQKR